jgi:hypothetical protein
MAEPQRIQRKRTAGWRMPEGAVYVGRPTRWGNPFEVRRAGSRRGARADMWGVWWAGTLLVRWDSKQDATTEAVDRFRRMLAEQRSRTFRGPTVAEVRAELAGKDLVCWCPPDSACHADVLLRLANEGPATVPDSTPAGRTAAGAGEGTETP